MFTYPPSPAILQWLSEGQFASRLHRSLRLWFMLDHLYGTEVHWAKALSQPFRYGELRDRLFVPSHCPSETLSAMALVESCRGTNCLCQRSLGSLLLNSTLPQSITEWVAETSQRTGLTSPIIEAQLDQAPFATVHRSLRDDLALLATQGWLTRVSRKGYHCLPLEQLPQPPLETVPTVNVTQLSPAQTWELLHVLEAITFVQPNIDVVIDTLWQQVTQPSNFSSHRVQEPVRRIFLHFDYILSPEGQEKVDELQQQIESLWRAPDGGVIQFDTWVAKEQRTASVTVYPVCLHYARRAKYLSAYGIDPFGQIAWHNYRLDRIRSAQLRILPWSDPAVPPILKRQRQTGTLPIPAWIEQQLEEAWGFNFYLPKALLILRFPVSFAKDYVDDTVRHPTFGKVSYQNLFALVRQHIPEQQERQMIQDLLRQRSSDDTYYLGWVRVGDINVIMRLRDWRPKGEVIAPLVLRQQMQAEVEAERQHYY